MIDAKRELQYRLAIRMLEHLSEKGLLSAKELAYAKGLAREKYAPHDFCPNFLFSHFCHIFHPDLRSCRHVPEYQYCQADFSHSHG